MMDGQLTTTLLVKHESQAVVSSSNGIYYENTQVIQIGVEKLSALDFSHIISLLKRYILIVEKSIYRFQWKYTFRGAQET